MVGRKFSLEHQPGCVPDSVAFSPADGLLFRGKPVGTPFGARADVGDKIGCGIKFDSRGGKNVGLSAVGAATVFFTINGKEMG